MELDWYTRNYDAMATQAAMFAGFAFEQITEPVPASTPFLLEMAYICLTALALGFNLCVCMSSTFCVIFGRRLGLFGSGARSVHLAVENMHKAQQFTFLQFLLGLLAYLMAHVFETWIYFRKNVALVLCIPLSVFVLAIIYYVVTIVDQLVLPDDKAGPRSQMICSSAVFGQVQAWSRYENLNDLDAEAYRYESRASRSAQVH
eukprot:symbB.v1.2.012778.t1/scaffold859.1/size157342/3